MPLLTSQIEDETGASIETKGVWVPDRTRMPPGEMPLYLHIVAKSQVVLDAAVREVQKLIDQELAPLIEERTLIARARATGQPLPPTVQPPREKWPEERLFINLEPMRNFNIRAKVVGPGVSSFCVFLCFVWQLVLVADTDRVCLSSLFRPRPARVCRSRDEDRDSWRATRVASRMSRCTLALCELFALYDN